MQEEFNHTYFFTATILEWKHLLINDKYKDIIVSSLRFLQQNKKVKIFAFVIMPNHIHIVWAINSEFEYSHIKRDFMKYTSQMIRMDLFQYHPALLNQFYVCAKDREYQIWERNSLSVEIFSSKVLEQKINYIHKNPLGDKWKLSVDITDYKYSSAKSYYENVDEFGFLEKTF